MTEGFNLIYLDLKCDLILKSLEQKRKREYLAQVFGRFSLMHNISVFLNAIGIQLTGGIRLDPEMEMCVCTLS